MTGMSWANVTQRMHNGSTDGNDLEDFVAHQISLREHLSAQFRSPLREPVERLIGQYLIDLVDDAGYIPADLEALSQTTWRAARTHRKRPRQTADVRSAGNLCPLARGMPGASAQRPEPLRSA